MNKTLFATDKNYTRPIINTAESLGLAVFFCGAVTSVFNS